MPYLLILATAVLAAVVGYTLVQRRREVRERAHHFRCPSCGQKLRFGKLEQGRRVMCPRCLKSYTSAELKQDQAADTPVEGPYQVKRRSSLTERQS